MIAHVALSFPLAILLSLSPSLTSAAPLLKARDGCTSLGKGPLGFNATSIGVYNYANPGYHLTFNNTQLNRYGDDYLLANPAHNYDNPEFFELIQCEETPPPFYDKGSIDVWQGYIKTSDGNCIQRTSIDDKEGQFSKKPCAYSLDDLTGDSAAQHFQFSLDTFYSYYSVVFLGSEQGPSADANTSFFSGGNYKLSLLGLSQNANQKFIEADYVSGEEQKGDSSTAMIAHLGSQYKPEQTQFPECTLVHNGTLTYTTGDGVQHPVSLKSVSYSYYNHGIAMALNGTESTPGFEFYQCDSEYMGYTSSGSSKYGHLVTYQNDDEDSQDCFQRISSSGPAGGAGPENVVYSVPNDSNCGRNDNSAQLSTYYHYDEESGIIQFLGSRASDQENAIKYYWALDGDQIILSNTTTSDVLRFT